MTALPVPGTMGAARGAASRSEAWTLRLATFAALGLFGGAHWAGIVRPGAGGDLLGLFLIALAAGIVAAAAGEVLTTRGRRIAAMSAIVLAALALILLVAGVPLWYLRPDRWDTLSVNIANAIATLPELRMPYRGTDPWVRTVLISGGGVLLLAGAILALAPRPKTFAATLCLGVLYVVAIIEHRPSHPYLDGILFSLLLGAMLWGERLSSREAPAAATIGVVAVLGSALLAPHLDSPRPWVDYEALAEALQGGKTTTFTWNHSYGPLNWPRDGLEIARVRARGDLYLKTANLEDFDGREWRQAKGVLSGGADTQFARRHPNWTQTIHVTVKGLKSRQFLVAGTTTVVNRSSKDVVPATPGTFQVSGKPLRRGDSYDAVVYVPTPGTVELHSAGVDYPYYVIRQLAVELPSQPGIGPVEVHFAPWGSNAASVARAASGFGIIDADQALSASPYAREYALAQELSGATTDPYDYVRKVIARVQRDARYTEAPPSPGRLEPLDAFLFRDHAGYCQYFAGATALLLRMGGVPARVVAGFSPGSRDGATHVIRDLDAHSWVEAYFPRLGWVTFDPTPGDSPARSQQTDTVSVASTAPKPKGRAASTGDRLSDPRAGGAAAAAGGGGIGLGAWLVLGGVALALVAGAAMMAVRRRRQLARSGDPELEELRLALQRSGRGILPELTLAKVEGMLRGSDGASGYVASLRVARYGAGGPSPTPRQRRALRRELAAGLGLGGRIRALWALPPRSAELVDALRPRRRRSYN
ncbi:transglutaminaseTgpA domain-containing protein [Baekduia sp.]|uniref:transglutaminase family protein n=1 Tax=Baekduia sp. TaxID=2600305 RepID=UPI002E04B885|nr:transglutaminaseTgpA domain-containing protein [Baekduia sp.]